MSAILAFIRPVWAIIKPFQKQIVLAIATILVAAWLRGLYEQKLQESYDRGVTVERAAQKKVAEKREQENRELTAQLRVDAAAAQAKLEGQLREANITADNLRAQLRTRRVCSDETSGRAVSRDSGASTAVDGAAENVGPPKPTQEDSILTIGDDLVTFGEQCQVTTDKLVSLQGYVRGVLDKLKDLRAKQLAAGHVHDPN